MRRLLLSAIMLPGMMSFAHAGEITSAYTKLDYDKGCRQRVVHEESGSASFLCEGYQGFPVFYSQGDLRVTMKYGFVRDPDAMAWESFAPWNSINTTIEWRIEDGEPHATILRWFIDNIDPETGSADPVRRGQVLVVSTIARGGNDSCMAGLVDARANTEANALARDVADSIARSFRCGQDTVRYYGKQGPLAPDVN